MWRRRLEQRVKIETHVNRTVLPSADSKNQSRIQPEENLNWAVSYADMLMVLMCFFVVFFSFESTRSTSKELAAKDASSSDIHPSIASIRKEFTAQSRPTAGGVGFLPGATNAGTSGTMTGANGGNGNSDEHGHYTIHLPDQLYRMRAFAVSSNVEYVLKRTLDVLLPHKDSIRIIFIGHSDSIPVTRTNTFLKNNFDLSSLRASRAISYALNMGFDANKMSISAVSSEIRNTRSLSLKILPASGD